ncbi:MAG: hypothetical protein K2F90_01650 [Clostridiales bacterium]|nr:hypothetical protein [Clostridiales bacterium]
MNLIICGILSLIALLVSVVLAVVFRHRLRLAVRALSIGFFITIFIAVSPCNIDGGKYLFGVNLFQTICVMITQSSLTETLGVIAQYKSSLVDAYGIYVTFLYVIGPISVAGATLSFFKGFGRFVYWVKSLFAESYVFSTVNERSLAVCKSIRDRHAKALILFALDGEKDYDESLTSRIEELGGIIVKQGAKDVKHNLRHKRHYYLLDKEAQNNIDQGLAINDKYKDCKAAYEKVDLLIYSAGEMPQLVFYNTKHNVTIQLFREEEIIANDLTFNHPLYAGVVDGKLNVLLVGCGKIGYEILKKVIWSGYLGKGVQTEINVIDQNAKATESRLKKECPALFGECELNIGFFDANVNDDSFTAALSQIGTPTYVVVALGDEKVNTEVCIYLRRRFGITNGYPLLHMTTNAEDYADKLDLINVYDWTVGKDRVFRKRDDTEQKFEIKGFGSYASAYRQLNPTESKFGMLALACHYAKMDTDWDGKRNYLNAGETKEQFVSSLSYSYNQIAFCKYNADQLALSIGYILFALGYADKCVDYLEKTRQSLGLQSTRSIPFALYLDPEYDFKGELQANIDEICALTTERFNRYMYTLGWTNLPVDEIRNRALRDQLRMKYARIGNYDVEALEKLMSAGSENKKDYRQNDKDEILKLPNILKLYADLLLLEKK